MGVTVKDENEISESDLTKVAEDLMEDVDAARRAISDIVDDDLSKMVFVTGLLFGTGFKQVLEASGDFEWDERHGYGIPFCLPFTEGGEWDGVTFQRFVVGIQMIPDSVHVHEDGDDEESEADAS